MLADKLGSPLLFLQIAGKYDGIDVDTGLQLIFFGYIIFLEQQTVQFKNFTIKILGTLSLESGGKIKYTDDQIFTIGFAKQFEMIQYLCLEFEVNGFFILCCFLTGSSNDQLVYLE